MRRYWQPTTQADRDKENKAAALQYTLDAEGALAAVKNLLADSLSKDHILDWEFVKDKRNFSKPHPSPPAARPLMPEPMRTEDRFQFQPMVAKIGFVDWIVPGRRKKKLGYAEAINQQRRNEAEGRFRQFYEEWKKECEARRNANQLDLTNFEKAKAAWILDKRLFYEAQRRLNEEVDELRKQHAAHSPEALKRYCAEVLARSEYPKPFPKDRSICFDPHGGVLVVDYELPRLMALPNVKNVKYSTSRQEFQKTFISEAESKRLYDDVLYQICLRTLYELFQSDQVDMIKSIVFNGWVDAVDKATGANTHPCVMTVQVSKNEFMALNLSQVDLKACFRSLKGISGGKLIDFTPVRPVLSLNREDPRFVNFYSVADDLSDQTNLAAMDWLDFENLIRELFEKEFSQNGGVVKITRASRDGGVDAIAFDPEPIRGGKIVIQAKRYTNTVGVAAVRDLFGTVHNEGAIKGILVT